MNFQRSQVYFKAIQLLAAGIIALLALCFLASCAKSRHSYVSGDTDSIENLQKMGNPANHNTSKEAEAKKIRYVAIQETALSVGAQSGLAWRSKHIDEQLQKQKNTLDGIYNFNALILDNNVLPPVLLEGRNILNLSDPNTIRIADRQYKIAKQARFVTTAPNWRQYLWMDYEKPEKPNETLLPQDVTEQRLWEYYVTIGWNEGAKQADIIFSNNIARLKEEFNGMLLYRKLLAQNMVSPPYVAATDLGVTGDSSEIHIDDRVLRITALPGLNPDSGGWRPAVAEDKQALIKYSKMGKLAAQHEIEGPAQGWQPVISDMSDNE